MLLLCLELPHLRQGACWFLQDDLTPLLVAQRRLDDLTRPSDEAMDDGEAASSSPGAVAEARAIVEFLTERGAETTWRRDNPDARAAVEAAVADSHTFGTA